jgi:hypothetical protein
VVRDCEPLRVARPECFSRAFKFHCRSLFAPSFFLRVLCLLRSCECAVPCLSGAPLSRCLPELRAFPPHSPPKPLPPASSKREERRTAGTEGKGEARTRSTERSAHWQVHVCGCGWLAVHAALV